MTETAEIFCEFKFEAAHRLPNVPSDHKCSRLHGHSYQLQVHVKGPIDDHAGLGDRFCTHQRRVQAGYSTVRSLLLERDPGTRKPDQ
ncbi:6-pyruvoyl trahydropterin synthase family protein [Mycolicibacterium fortuitum]